MSEEQVEAAATKLPVSLEMRRWRRARGMTLAQVGERSGLNVGYLSQIENGKALPSLEALASIADGLDVPVAWLLVDSTPPPRLVRAGERPVLPAIAGGSLTEVDAGTSRDLCILEAVVPPGGSTGEHAHAGDEHQLVLSGRFRMTQGGTTVEIGPGDYLAWDPTVPHNVENIGDEPGRILIMYPRHGRRTGDGAGDSAPRTAGG